MVQWPKQRAWGWYATLIRTPWFCIKLLRFRPYGKLSMQRHKHRTEVWCFFNARGLIRKNCVGHVHKIKMKNSWGFWIILCNTWHQFIAYNKPVYILEFQYGKKVTEDDIERR